MSLFTPMPARAIRVYEIIEREYSLNGYSPSIVEIVSETGICKSMVNRYLKHMVAANWLTNEARKVRAYVPIKEPRVYYRRGT